MKCFSSRRIGRILGGNLPPFFIRCIYIITMFVQRFYAVTVQRQQVLFFDIEGINLRMNNW